jgi:plastocyanin domain-containing protein
MTIPMSLKDLTLRIAAITLTVGLVLPALAAPKGKTVAMAVTEKGFEPASVQVKKDEPVTLLITRKTDKTCATEIVIDEQKVNAKLPLNKEVKVTFTPKKSGELKYGCAMNKMIGGVLRVE